MSTFALYTFGEEGGLRKRYPLYILLKNTITVNLGLITGLIDCVGIAVCFHGQEK